MNTEYYTGASTVEVANKDSKYAKLKYLVIDVDGTMTDGGVYYDENGNELKKFNTRDAAGFFTAKISKIKILVLTGRECKATTKRMKELQVEFLEQKITDKVKYLEEFMEKNNIVKDEIGYIGDDLNDFNAMKMTGFVGCPNDACEEIMAISNYVSKKNGGDGAVRDIIAYLLMNRGQWEEAIAKSYHLGI